MTNLENLGLEIHASGSSCVFFRNFFTKNSTKLYFGSHGQVPDWIMSTPESNMVYNVDMLAADYLK